MNRDTASNKLSVADLAFFGSQGNWNGGPQLDVVLTYRTFADAEIAASRIHEFVEVMSPWSNVWQTPINDNRARGCVIVSPSGLLASFGFCYYTTTKKQWPRKTGEVVEIPPRLHFFIAPRHLKRACGTDEFLSSTETTQLSLRLFEYLVELARRAYTVLHFEYGYVLDETWGFLGSPEHNPCLAIYRQYAEAAGLRIVGFDQNHALISVI